MKKYILLTVFCILSIMCICSCNKKDKNKKYDYYLYYINSDITTLVKEGFTPKADVNDVNAMLEEYIDMLRTEPDSVEYEAPCGGKIRITDYKLENNQLYVYFDNEYLELDAYQEILCRAAIVKSLVQIDGVDSVAFYIQDSPLTDITGNVVGFMTADSFAEDSGEKLNTIQSSEIKLFFTNSQGDRLVEERQLVHYSSTISMEKLIVEQLIAGPTSSSCYPVLPKKTKLLSVSVKDGTCYVNLSNEFMVNEYDVDDNVVIYAIVNSLVELPNVNNVQITVNSEAKVMYMETISLNKVFTRNLDIVESTGSSKSENKPELTIQTGTNDN